MIMKIWIRTQNKEVLTLCKEFEILPIETIEAEEKDVEAKPHIIRSIKTWSYKGTAGVRLGVYHNKAEALKVLDTISTCLQNRITCSSSGDVYDCVFDMPEDSQGVPTEEIFPMP